MSYTVIDRETTQLLRDGALRKVDNDELFKDRRRFNGRVMVITGAGSGLGRAFAVDAARNGAKVVIGDVNQSGLDETLKLIHSVRGNAVGQSCDVTSWDSQLSLFKLAHNTYGQVDIVVANAGISDVALEDFVDPDQDLQKPNLKTLDVDLVGVIFTARIGLHYMRRSPLKEGKTLVLIASYAGFYGSPVTILYAPAKHAVLGLGRSLRYITPNDGINCITLCPYYINTPITAPVYDNISKDPMAKIEDFVGAATYACTATSQLASGTVLFVDPKGVLVTNGRRYGGGGLTIPKL